jgi:hypothetical protein
MMAGEKISSAIKGATGEFYVAAYLSALNLVVALPRGGVPSSDLLVTTPSGGKTISLQIKTATTLGNRYRKCEYLTWGKDKGQTYAIDKKEGQGSDWQKKQL